MCASWTRTSRYWHEAVRNICQLDKVRTILRRTTRTRRVLARVPPCLCAASRVPNPDPHFLGGSAAHAGSLERRASRRCWRWQDASFLRRRKAQSLSGGTRAPQRAPVAIAPYHALGGPGESVRAGANGCRCTTCVCPGSACVAVPIPWTRPVHVAAAREA